MLEVLEFEVRVDLSGVEVAMAEEMLHMPQAGAAAKKMSRTGVTKGVP